MDKINSKVVRLSSDTLSKLDILKKDIDSDIGFRYVDFSFDQIIKFCVIYTLNMKYDHTFVAERKTR